MRGASRYPLNLLSPRARGLIALRRPLGRWSEPENPGHAMITRGSTSPRCSLATIGSAVRVKVSIQLAPAGIGR